MLTEYSLAVSTAPTNRPVTVAQAKKQLEIADDVADHDAHISDLIDVAIECVENDSRRALVTQTLVQKMHHFPLYCEYIEIKRGPLASVTSISYVDANGDSQTWSSSNYIVDTARKPGAIWLAYSASFPTTRGHVNDVTITYVAGEAVTSVPAAAKQAILLLVTHAFEQREPIIIGSTSKEIELSYHSLISRLHYGSYP